MQSQVQEQKSEVDSFENNLIAEALQELKDAKTLEERNAKFIEAALAMGVEMVL